MAERKRQLKKACRFYVIPATVQDSLSLVTREDASRQKKSSSVYEEEEARGLGMA